jgi:hypothetical protein
MKGKNTFGMMRSVLNVFKLNYAAFIHKCLSVRLHMVMNIKLEEKKEMFPSGFYRMTTKVTDDITKGEFNVSLLWEVTNQ